MYKVLKADRDTYLTDRVINSVRQTLSNVGAAGSLDLFKLYGITSVGDAPNIELSRLLIHFNLDPIRDLINRGKLDPSNSTFSCHLKLFDVYGGQPTPREFTVTVHPLSRSFEEGLGRDVVFYGDSDISNFLTGSRVQGPWILSGANSGGALNDQVDYLASAVINGITSSLEFTQFFNTGEEDLYVDVTTAVSATLAGLIPDEGFRIALTASQETDNRSYFVKRFAARSAYNEDKHPQLIFRFDDSIQDDFSNLSLDESGSLFLYNYAQGAPSNLLSASVEITGSNCLILKLITPISGGTYEVAFTGSQHLIGTNPATGIYSASVFLSSQDPVFIAALAQSGSITFTPVWGSLDGTVSYLTGSQLLTVLPPARGPSTLEPQLLLVSVTGLKPEHWDTETTTVRVNIFDESSPRLIKKKLPVNAPGTVIRDVFYSVRENITDLVVIPFDKGGSTRVSSDASGMYFKLDASNLQAGRSYVIDIMISTNDNDQIFRAASSAFKVVSTP